jgi:FkbM family methyltransferase
MKTLVYLGCNQGDSLFRLLNFNFDKILCIDADPIAIDTLTKRFGHIKNLIIINTCLVPDKNISEVEFYFNKNRATNSILKPKCLEIEEKKIIKASYLPNILDNYDIKNIDLYISDLQGKDFEVLETLKSLINDKKIEELFMETHNDLNPYYYEAKNHVTDFTRILSENYKINYISSDSRLLNETEANNFLNNVNIGEADIHWSLKNNTQVKYRI